MGRTILAPENPLAKAKREAAVQTGADVDGSDVENVVVASANTAEMGLLTDEQKEAWRIQKEIQREAKDAALRAESLHFSISQTFDYFFPLQTEKRAEYLPLAVVLDFTQVRIVDITGT